VIFADTFAMSPSGIVAVQEYGSSSRRWPRSVSTKITALLVSGVFGLGVLGVSTAARGQVASPAGAGAVPAASSTAPAPGAAPPATTSGQTIAYGDMKGFYEREVTWDLNLEGGWGRAFGDASRPVGFGRVRGGVLWVHEPWYTSVGLFYDLSSFTPATFGIQTEQMQLTSGLWVQAGAGVDVQPRPMVMAGLGWSIFGVEIQYRDFGSVRDVNTGAAVYGTLRVPVSIIARVFRTRHP
jgi:hypothetical protein